jgi:hypothetical protein
MTSESPSLVARPLLNHMVVDNHMIECYPYVMLKFYATVEFLKGQSAAILELTDQQGDFAGAGRIEVRSGRRSDLYEEAYRQASLNASGKGGRLERFSVVGEASPVVLPTWRTYRETCHARLENQQLRRPANALNVEIGTAMDRCVAKRPSHWPEHMSALRWIASGGAVLVFGLCSPACPYLPE